MTTKQRQNLLAYLGYYSGDIDGIYGQQTKAAVERFQEDFGVIAVDGLAGDETDKAIRHAVAYGMPDSVMQTTPVDKITENSVSVDKENSTTASADADKYLQSDGCYHIPRGVDVQLSKNLWAHEIHCQGNGCCRESIISKQMVEMFQRIRDDYGDSIEIAQAGGSGYRCSIHNSEVGGAYASLHMTGNALDLHCRDKEKLLIVVNRHVTDGEIGVYSWGIHVGVWNRGFVNRFTYG